MNRRVILAMSGGVDSSVAAHLLKKKGYEVIGITLKLWPRKMCGSHGNRSCCSVESINDARGVCAKLKIPHYLIGCERLFKKEVIDYFVESYKRGYTPNPCIRCNEKIKMPLMIQKAREVEAGYIATGHYARCGFSRKARCFFIREAMDKKKDQSYVLFGLTQKVLSRLLLPLGEFKKDDVRSMARSLRLRVHNKQESQEICFIADNNLRRFLSVRAGSNMMPGDIKDKNGRVLGKHPGTSFFTVGQRKGLRIPFGSPLYITAIRAKSNDIIVGGYKDTLRKDITAGSVSWMGAPAFPGRALRVKAKIRYRHTKSPATLKFLSARRCRVTFDRPQSSPAPGQAVVFYKRDTVLGGGWIR